MQSLPKAIGQHAADWRSVLRLCKSKTPALTTTNNQKYDGQRTCTTPQSHLQPHMVAMIPNQAYSYFHSQNLNYSIDHSNTYHADSTMHKIESCTTVAEILDLSDAMKTHHISVATEKMMLLQYRKLLDSIVWLQKNVHVGYIQLLLHGSLTTSMSSILEHEKFPVLESVIMDNITKLEAQPLVNTYLALLYLGVDQTSTMIHAMRSACLDQINTCDIAALGTFCNIFKAQHRTEIQAVPKVFKRLAHLMDEKDSLNDPQAINHLCKLGINFLYFMSPEYMQKVASSAFEILQDPQLWKTPANVGTYAWFAQRLFRSPHTNKETFIMSRKMLDLVAQASPNLMDQMQPENIAEICQKLKLSRCYTKETAAIFEQRSVFLLPQQNRLPEISNLFYALTRKTPAATRRQFEAALYGKLEDSDVILLSNMAEYFLHSSVTNEDLLRKFQAQVVKHADTVVRHISRFQKISKCLIHKKFKDPAHELVFCETVLAYLDKQHGIHDRTISSAASFILPSCRNALPEDLQQKLLATIPKWNTGEMYKLAVGINAMRQPLTLQFQRQLLALQNCLHTSIMEKLPTVENVDYLYMLATGLITNNKNPDPSLTDQLMRHFLCFSKDLNETTIEKVARMFGFVKYHLPELYEDMVQFVCRNNKQLHKDKVLGVVNACYAVGYQPNDKKSFMDVCLDLLEVLKSGNTIEERLMLLRSLCGIQCFLEEQLGEVFQLDFIEKLDQYMTEVPQSRKLVEQCMMELNRMTALECPQLDVPWFHDQYCKENVIPDEFRKGSGEIKFKDEVGQCLSDVLGGDEYIQDDVFTPYCYPVDFECVLGEHGHAVAVKDVGDDTPPGCQRVAVLALMEPSYCCNSKQLTGPEQIRKRHLEIMGYKVVEVAYFDWYSMGMTDMETKMDYIDNQIFT